MKSTLLRTGSIPVQRMNRTPSLTGSVHYSSSSSSSSSPRVSFRSEKVGFGNNMKRSNSDSDLIRSELSRSGVIRVGSVSFPDLGVIVEEEGFGIGFGNGNDFGGKGKGGKNNGNNNGSNDNMDEYYKEMLKSNPGDSLLLRNYGKYLHEVEKNVEKAEEYYGRAILASPGDGEILSLYGNLIWETSKDQDRANLYFDQAINASPNDCMVLGSYAHFLWEAEEDEEEDQYLKKNENASLLTMVGVH